MSNNNNNLHLAAILLAALIWSLSFTTTKTALLAFPPFGLGTIRFLLPAILLGIFLTVKGQLIYPDKEDMPRFWLSGFFGITAYYALENTGIKLSTASDAALLVASIPIITMLLERIIYKTPISLKAFIGVILAIIGVYIIVAQNPPTPSENRLLGNTLLLLVGFVWAGYNFTTRTLVNKYPMPVVSFYQFSAGVICFLPFLPFDLSPWRQPALESILAYLFLSIFCSFIAYYVYAFGLRKVPASTAIMLLNIVPIFGIFFAWLLLGEKIQPSQIMGGIIIICGVSLGIRKTPAQK